MARRVRRPHRRAETPTRLGTAPDTPESRAPEPGADGVCSATTSPRSPRSPTDPQRGRPEYGANPPWRSLGGADRRRDGFLSAPSVVDGAGQGVSRKRVRLVSQQLWFLVPLSDSPSNPVITSYPLGPSSQATSPVLWRERYRKRRCYAPGRRRSRRCRVSEDHERVLRERQPVRPCRGGRFLGYSSAAAIVSAVRLSRRSRAVNARGSSSPFESVPGASASRGL